MSPGNVYSAEPAFPVLAYSLLSQTAPEPADQGPQSESESAPSQDEAAASGAWNLKHDIDRVLSSRHTIFRCGKVIGFSRPREKGDDDDTQCVTRLPLHLLTTHLHRNPSKPAISSPNAFLIHPANFEPFAPKTLLASLLSPARSPLLSRDEAIRRLDSVQLLPVFDFRSVVQAINEVSDALHTIQKERDQSDQMTLAGVADHPVLLIIAGLDALAEGVVRASNPGRGAAVLAATLRTLTQLSRMHASFLSVMLVNTTGLGALSLGPGSADHDQRETRQTRDDSSVHSAFRQSGSSLFPSLMLKTLDQGIDTHLLLSTVRNTPVVEIVKDREGDGVGKWCPWD
ncbi:hypothetical protein PHISP_05443 [Aspergillus sp. HF37]|nr:hypothetical protein PHISP_05443 [Aspergillus sp. HF37]